MVYWTICRSTTEFENNDMEKEKTNLILLRQKHEPWVEAHDHRKDAICQRAAYVAVAVIIALVTVFVLFPLSVSYWNDCSSSFSESEEEVFTNDVNCRISLVESIPDNLTYPSGSPAHQSTYDTWIDLIDNANKTIDIVAFYWTLRGVDIDFSDPSDWQGEDVFKKLMFAVTNRGIKLRIVQSIPSNTSFDNDSFALAAAGAEVRSINFTELFGSGVLHTKMWIVDGQHFYVGSANMDWRSLTQVKELGVLVKTCRSVTADASKLFDVYWYLGKDPKIPKTWPKQFNTRYNNTAPMNVSLNGTQSRVYLSSSPPEFCPTGRTSDIDAILDVISKAKKFVYIAVMDYSPSVLFSKPRRFWPIIDDALRRVAYENDVEVRLMASQWNHTKPDMIKYMRSLQDLNGIEEAQDYHKTVKIAMKLFHVPSFTEAQQKIPFGRVNHNKYMVTDNVAYIGTSNWSGDYFISTGGVGMIVNQTQTDQTKTVQQQLLEIFERDWNSKYAIPIDASHKPKGAKNRRQM